MNPSFGLCLPPSLSYRFLLSTYSPSPPLPLSFPLISLPPTSKSFHSCACHRNLKIGSSTPAEYNTTTTATSHLHHQHDNVKLETHRLTWSVMNRCCGGSCSDILRKISHEILHFYPQFILLSNKKNYRKGWKNAKKFFSLNQGKV